MSLVLQEGVVIEEGVEDLLLEDHNTEFLSQGYLLLAVGKTLRTTCGRLEMFVMLMSTRMVLE